jgi:uncharacterized membrane protein (DUF373 family)
MEQKILSFHKRFEKVIVVIILIMMMVVVAAAVFDMVIKLVQTFTSYTSVDDLVTIDELYGLFASFLLILIGVELLETVKMYLHENAIRLEIVVIVAIISVARHLISINFDKSEALNLLATGAVFLALTFGYYLIKRTDKFVYKLKEKKENPD